MKLKLLTIFPSLSKNSLLTTPLYKVPCTACDWLVLSFKFPRASVNQLETLQVPKIFIYRSLLSFCLQGYWFRRDDTMREDSTDSHRWKSGHHWFIRTDNSITGRDDPCSQRNGKTRFQDSPAYWRSDNVKLTSPFLYKFTTEARPHLCGEFVWKRPKTLMTTECSLLKRIVLKAHRF